MLSRGLLGLSDRRAPGGRITSLLPPPYEDCVILNLGCGHDRIEGYTNIDIVPTKEADVVCDACSLPFEDDSVDGVYGRHFLEHIENPYKLFEELNRVCKDGAKIRFITPYWSSWCAIADPGHKRFYGLDNYFYFSKRYYKEGFLCGLVNNVYYDFWVEYCILVLTDGFFPKEKDIVWKINHLLNVVDIMDVQLICNKSDKVYEPHKTIICRYEGYERLKEFISKGALCS